MSRCRAGTASAGLGAGSTTASFPRREGQIPVGQPTPRCDLGLKPGVLVRVKPYQEILATLDTTNSNRGLSFDAELVPYCGKIYRVKTRVDKFIDEKTGKMRHLRTPAVMLEGVYCKSRYCGQRMFCPRSIYSWWREIWLEQVSEAPTGNGKWPEADRRLPPVSHLLPLRSFTT